MAPRDRSAMTAAASLVAAVCALTFVHFAAAQMRGPLVPLYAAAHGVTATGVGFIVAAHMVVAGVASIPLGRASDVWGRRILLLSGMATSAVASLLLIVVESGVGLAVIYGLAGLGVAAFTPSAMSLVGDAARPGAAGRAYAWYATAHYGAIGVGPFLGGLAAERWGYPRAFVASAAGAAIAFVLGFAIPLRSARANLTARATFGDVRANPSVWAGWIAAASGLLTQGVVFTFFPLLADSRGLSPATIGFVFLVVGIANTAARVPAGWLVDRTHRSAPYAVGGVLAGCIATALLPHVTETGRLLPAIAAYGVVSGIAGVAIGVALAGATTPAARGVVMGGYSTALYLGLAIGSFALGPVITHYGYAAGFGLGALVGAVGALIAAILWTRAPTHDRLCSRKPTNARALALSGRRSS
jgi:predicted MFS family arabinose efflux permease